MRISYLLILSFCCQLAFAKSENLPPPSAPACVGEQGKVEWLVWENQWFRKWDDFYANPYYPNTPLLKDELRSLKLPKDYNDTFGAMVRGFIKPTTTGAHTFNVTGNQKVKFYLSDNENPTPLIQRCEVESSGETQHDKQTTQTSTTLILQADQYYYFEVHQIESWGGDHATVYWKTPDHSDWRVVPNVNLYQYTCGTYCEPTGTPCDDGDPTTNGDVYDGFCNCLGVPATTETCVGKRGQVRTLIYNDIPNYGLEELYASPKFPHQPDSIRFLTELANPYSDRDNFGTKLAAYLLAPATGTYTFNVTGDDQTVLFLSTNHDPANKSIIASVTGWSKVEEHDKYTTQTSGSIELTKGQLYYLEVNQHDSYGGDHFNVYWKSDHLSPNNWLLVNGLNLLDYTCDVSCVPAKTPCDDGNDFTKDDAYDDNCNCVGTPCIGTGCDPVIPYQAYGACDVTDKHSENPADSWLSCDIAPNPNPTYDQHHWIQYDFGGVYPVEDCRIWNYNVAGSTNLGFREVAVDYSVDGETWTNLGIYNWNEAPGNTNYDGFPGPRFDGLLARYVLINGLNNHGGGDCAGFSQVYFDLGSGCQVGQPCDDGDPTTTHDLVDANCNCKGVGKPLNLCEQYDITQGLSVLTSDSYNAENIIESAATIAPDTRVNLVAGTSVSLKPGFHAKPGAQFHAATSPCVAYTDNPITSVEEIPESDIPQSQKPTLTVMPNPTNTWTNFTYSLPEATPVTLSVYTADGQLVSSIAQEQVHRPGNYSKAFPAQKLASGLYHVTLRTDKEVLTKRFVRIE